MKLKNQKQQSNTFTWSEQNPRVPNMPTSMLDPAVKHRIILLHKLANHNMSTEKTTTRSSAITEGPRDASCQTESCQLPRNSAETTYTTSPDQIDGMKLEI